MIPTLESERLRLRQLTLDDAPAVQKFAGAFEVADTTLSIPHPYEDGMAEGWIERVRESNQGGEILTLAITFLESDVLIGSISLIDIKESYKAEMGFAIGVPYWNKGFCTEASALFLSYAFESMNLHRVYAHHFSRNPSSGRVLQKIGMLHEGTLVDHVKKWDKYESIELYGIVRSD